MFAPALPPSIVPAILAPSIKVKLSFELPPVIFSISEKIMVSVGEPIFSATLPAFALVICQSLSWSRPVKVSAVLALPIKV